MTFFIWNSYEWRNNVRWGYVKAPSYLVLTSCLANGQQFILHTRSSTGLEKSPHSLITFFEVNIKYSFRKYLFDYNRSVVSRVTENVAAQNWMVKIWQLTQELGSNNNSWVIFCLGNSKSTMQLTGVTALSKIQQPVNTD